MLRLTVVLERYWKIQMRTKERSVKSVRNEGLCVEYDDWTGTTDEWSPGLDYGNMIPFSVDETHGPFISYIWRRICSSSSLIVFTHLYFIVGRPSLPANVNLVVTNFDRLVNSLWHFEANLSTEQALTQRGKQTSHDEVEKKGSSLGWRLGKQ